ncbi:hypothetical protein BACI9J_130593 [Bacillus altitudinis]|nr:hypothetical protein BACI9J_130593 [Bacillus altitudinis]
MRLVLKSVKLYQHILKFQQGTHILMVYHHVAVAVDQEAAVAVKYLDET